VSSEALGEEEVARGSVHICDRGIMSQAVKWVVAPESRPLLPGVEEHVDSSRGDPPARESAEERRLRRRALVPLPLVAPESRQLGDKSFRQEHVTDPAALGNGGADPDAFAGHPRREEDVAHVQAHEFSEAEARAQGEREDQVIPQLGRGDQKQGALLVAGQGLW